LLFRIAGLKPSRSMTFHIFYYVNMIVMLVLTVRIIHK